MMCAHERVCLSLLRLVLSGMTIECAHERVCLSWRRIVLSAMSMTCGREQVVLSAMTTMYAHVNGWA